MKKLAILGLSIVLLLFSACKKDEVTPTIVTPPTPEVEFNSTVISSTVTDLFETRGDATSDIVWIYVQGGPTTERDYVFEETNPDGTDAYPFITDDFRVYPFQVQQINEDFKIADGFTFEQAKVESAKNAEIIKNIIEHFVSQNKTVYTIGHSYGSFIVNEVLATYGPLGEKIVSLNGRLDMDEVVWQGFSKGEEWLFDANGENPTLNSTADNSLLEQNMRKMAAGLGFNRYSQKLANVDLSSAIFVTADSDEFVGDFTQDAISFLLDTDAALLFLPEGAGHSDVFEPSFFEFLHDQHIVGSTSLPTFGIFTILNDNSVFMSGEIGDNTLVNFEALIGEYPNINQIIIGEVPGSFNDEINLQVSKLVYDSNIAIHLNDDGLIASGGVDFFLAGRTRTIGSNTQIGVHSWGGEDGSGNTVTATDFPVGHEFHLEYINYYKSIGFTQEDAEAFYYFTINAAGADEIHWMTAEEIAQYKLLTE